MKKLIILLLILIPFLAFSQLNCAKKVKFGNANICFPKINGMTESYSDPNVKIISDTFKGSEDEEIFAVYLKNENLGYEKMLNNGLGYPLYKLYGNKKFEEINVSEEMLKEFFIIIKKTLGKDMSSLIKKINGKFNDIAIGELSIEKPVLIDSHIVNKKSRTYTLLMKLSSEGIIINVVLNMSVINIQSTLIFLGSYSLYDGVESIEEINKQSDYFIKEMFKLND